ncbi:ASKHA domain-containing protein [Rhodospirillales bacterium]|nr:ASKHA domain-containing protein [Rhodospirillales bacterium]
MPNQDQSSFVVFMPSGRRGRFPMGTPILDCARQLGVDIDSVCGGRGICGRCQVVVAEGDFAKHGISSQAEHVSPRGEPENRYDSRKGLAAERRLSCHALLWGDVVIDVPPDSQVHKQIVRKRAEVRDIQMDPAIRLHYCVVEEPDMHNPLGDFERLSKALREQWDIEDLEEIDIRELQSLQKALRDGNWTVTVAVHRGVRITGIWSGFMDKAYGIAFDIGSTTIAGHLCDLSSGEVLASGGLMNPQIRFGEDLMSRVSYIMMNPGGECDLIDTIQSAISELAKDIIEDAGVSADKVLNVTVVGNPIMHHLFLGINPIELGGAPFALTTNSGMTLWATEVNLTTVNPDARVYMLPCIAGHVGADTAGVILSEEPHLRDEMTLIVDVGTNAEIVLGNRHKLLAASSPTGPAFEGAQISSGQRAAPGAIERLRIDPETLEPRFKVIGCDLWSNEQGFAEETAATGVTGICGSGIIEALGEMLLAGILLSEGTIDGTAAARSDRIRPDGRTFIYHIYDGAIPISVTQNDIRAIQLAKSALYAGAALLMDKLEVDHVDRIVLAGAFGTHIDPKYAMIIGMIPDCGLDRVVAAGNAAGTGARIALLNQQSRDEIQRIVKTITKVETAVEPRFQEHFVKAMSLPHLDAPYQQLQAEVPELAARRFTAPEGPLGDGGRRRRRRGR